MDPDFFREEIFYFTCCTDKIICLKKPSRPRSRPGILMVTSAPYKSFRQHCSCECNGCRVMFEKCFQLLTSYRHLCICRNKAAECQIGPRGYIILRAPLPFYIANPSPQFLLIFSLFCLNYSVPSEKAGPRGGYPSYPTPSAPLNKKSWRYT